MLRKTNWGEQGLTRKKLKGGGWLRKCGPGDGVGTTREDGGGDGRLEGCGPRDRRDMGDVEQGQRSDPENRERRHEVRLGRACGCFGSEGQTPYAARGPCRALQVSGGAEPEGRSQQGAGPAAGRRAGCASLLLGEQRGPRSWSWTCIPSRGPGGSRGRGRAGAGSNDMGSADSKLNFRKAVIQLTTKTQVRRGSRPPHPPAGLGAGQGRGTARTWLAQRRGGGFRLARTLRPGLEPNPLACTPGLPPEP